MNLHLDWIHLWALIIGFVIGFLLYVSSFRAHWKTKTEFRRYKKMLSDKMDLEHKQLSDLQKERERIGKENESMRLQISRLNDRSDNKLQREMEIYARAEKQMTINAPGFAPAWEIAKSQALTQLETEERGNSFPQRIFRKLVGGNTTAALPAEATAHNTSKNGSNSGAVMSDHSI
jgi:regulator of replication initiation timing